jgi:hypothetical protein
MEKNLTEIATLLLVVFVAILSWRMLMRPEKNRPDTIAGMIGMLWVVVESYLHILAR